MTRLYRFTGDYTGYRVEDDQPATGWVDALKGSTEDKVRVNVDKAYLWEDYEAAIQSFDAWVKGQ